MSENVLFLFEIHAYLKNELAHAAYFAIKLTEYGKIEFVELQYTPEYQRNPNAIPILPEHPVNNNTYVFRCTGDNVPGFIDELLPDTWGQTLIARKLRGQGIKRNPTVADLLTVPSGSYLGCFTAVPSGTKVAAPKPGIHLVNADVAETIRAAKRVDRLQGTEDDIARIDAAGGSSPGGARPKFLAYDDAGFWLAKLERDSDKYDLLSAEHVALELVRDAGLNAPVSKIVHTEDQRMLLIERFDLDTHRHRVNTFTANPLLKDHHSQADISFASYQDIARLIKKYSDQPKEDLRQLLGQALLNNLLANTDDHLRNFSFCMDNEGCRLSPAYDIVPTPVVGAYHQLNWEHSPILPGLSEAGKAARDLGLPESEGKALKEAILTSLKKHAPALEAAGSLSTGALRTY